MYKIITYTEVGLSRISHYDYQCNGDMNTLHILLRMHRPFPMQNPHEHETIRNINALLIIIVCDKIYEKRPFD